MTIPRSRLDPRLAGLLAGIGADPDESQLDELDNELIAPSAGLVSFSASCPSRPDGNSINLSIVRPAADGPLPCVYYIHGGGMARYSCYTGIFRTWIRLIAHQGVAVIAVDFRNSLVPSSTGDLGPYPAGLNDCVSGLRWVHEHAAELGVDPSRIIVEGESGGANLSLALGMTLLREGDLHRIRGLYVACPFIAGRWPQDRFPSSAEYDGVLLDAAGSNRSAAAYGAAAYAAGDPLAWPGFAAEDDVRGLVPTRVSVNECDPLRDEGIALYRLLLRAGVPTRCRQLMGMVHAAELFTDLVPDVSREAAADVARFCREVSAG